VLGAVVVRVEHRVAIAVVLLREELLVAVVAVVRARDPIAVRVASPGR